MMLFGWEGNHRSCIALVIHHRVTSIPSYRLNGLIQGDEHAINALVEYSTFKGKGSTILDTRVRSGADPGL